MAIRIPSQSHASKTVRKEERIATSAHRGPPRNDRGSRYAKHRRFTTITLVQGRVKTLPYGKIVKKC